MIRLFSLALAAWALAAAGARAEPIVYEARPVAAGAPAVDVTLSFRGDADGQTEVRLPETWAGAGRLDRIVVDAWAEGARIDRRGASLRLRHRPGEAVRLTYRLVQDYPGPPRAGFDRPYRPSIQAEGFTLVGWTVFARVVGREDAAVRFAWGPAPENWTLASDLDHAGGAEMAFADLGDSILMGGRDLEVVALPAAGGTVRVARHGSWPYPLSELAGRYARVVEAASAFWNDGERPFFLAVTPLTGPSGVGAQAGLGLGDGLAVWLSDDLSLDGASHVIVHEQQHAWLPDHVGGLGLGSEVLDYWFSEGFTDFYTLRMALRLGLNTPERHLAELDRALRLQAEAPPRVGNAELARAFFSDPRMAGLPYHRGLLLALVLDGRLRARSGGARDLDDVILAMRNGEGSAPTRLVQAFAEQGGGGLGPDLLRHVDRGEPIRLPPDLFGDCVRIDERGGRQSLSPGPGLTGPGRDGCVARLAGL